MLKPATTPTGMDTARLNRGATPSFSKRKPQRPKNAKKNVQNLNLRKTLKSPKSAPSASISASASKSKSASGPKPPANDDTATSPPPAISATIYTSSNTISLLSTRVYDNEILSCQHGYCLSTSYRTKRKTPVMTHGCL